MQQWTEGQSKKPELETEPPHSVTTQKTMDDKEILISALN